MYASSFAVRSVKVKGNNMYKIVGRGNSDITLDGVGVRPENV
jgi:hypothetical protein